MPFLKGYIPSEEHKNNLRLAMLGRHLSKKHRENISKANKGKISLKRNGYILICPTCSKEFYRSKSEIEKYHAKFCSLKCRRFNQLSRLKMSLKKIGQSNFWVKGKNNWNWKGGKTISRGYISIEQYKQVQSLISEIINLPDCSFLDSGTMVNTKIIILNKYPPPTIRQG